MTTTKTCTDCGIDTLDIHEWYTLHDEVWAATGHGPDDGYLCIGCAERRLGHTLTGHDFADAPINDIELPFPKSKRLINRLQTTPRPATHPRH